MIPKTGWKPMTTAPRDGRIIIVLYRTHNAKDGTPQVQPAQWLPDYAGKNWGWRKPWSFGTTAFADTWMTFEEFAGFCETEEQPPSVEFDL